MAIITNLDPINKNMGRPFKYNHTLMIDIILNMTRSGNSWERMGQYYKINADTIRKRFYKWVDLDVFKQAKRTILKIYKKNKQSIENNFYIDSTIITNHTGSLDFGYSYKIKK